MGGLLARNYIKDATRATNVHKLVEMGTPHVGTPTFLAHLLYPKGAPNIPIMLGPFSFGSVHAVNVIEAENLVQNFTGAFELLPTSQYYQSYHSPSDYS